MNFIPDIHIGDPRSPEEINEMVKQLLTDSEKKARNLKNRKRRFLQKAAGGPSTRRKTREVQRQARLKARREAIVEARKATSAP